MNRKQELSSFENRRFAVFDIDGTLARDSLFTAILHEFKDRGMIKAQEWAAAEASYQAWQQRAGGYDDYLEACLEVFRDTLLPDLAVSDYEAVLGDVMEVQQNLIYTYPRDLITYLKERDYLILGLSGSHQRAIDDFCAAHRFDDWVGTVYVENQGRFTGELHTPADSKDIYLAHLINLHNLDLQESIAIGDTTSDIPMLEAVTYPICFNPSRHLVIEALERNWPIVIERKDVVYTIQTTSETPDVDILAPDWHLQPTVSVPPLELRDSGLV